MADLGVFDPNDYRKRVLAAVEKRGGPEASDPFELYDLPVDPDDLDDAAVAERVAEVWGAWQRQRDHPKYRVLVGLLVAGHAERSVELLDAGRRRTAAARVRAQRAQRDAARYALLDAAVSRLVARHRGVPRDKVEGLHEVGALAGLDRAEVAARLRRHRVVDPSPPAASLIPAASPITDERRRQVRALLDELGRLTDEPAPPTLLALLELDPGAGDAQVRARAGAWRSRARELPPERLRTVLDELFVHVAELLEPGRTAVETYLDAVAADVAEHLRPRVRAAVLVEDRLVADDHAHLLDEALARGLDRARATAVLAAVAAELGAPVDTAPTAPAPAPAVRRDAEWEEPLRAARAAMRAGRPVEAQRLVREAGRLADADAATRVRAVSDEIDAVLAEAHRRRRAASAARAARRFTEALDHLDELARTAADVADLDAERVQARREVASADAAVAAALAGPEAARAAALAAVLTACPGHPAAAEALAAIPLAAPAWVRAAREARGGVLVSWEASASPGVGYRVSRMHPDGGWQVLGRVPDTSLLDGGGPDTVDVPVYAVAVVAPGRASAATRSDEQTPTADAADAPSAVRAERGAGGSVTVRWSGPDGVEYRVRCRMPDGRWRVVGRTRGRSLEDGGAPSGPLMSYTVSASVDGTRSVEVPG